MLIIVYFFLIDRSIYLYKMSFFVSGNIFCWKFILDGITIATLALLCLLFACDIFFHPLPFKLLASLNLKCVSYSQHIVVICFLSCLSFDWIFNPLRFNVIWLCWILLDGWISIYHFAFAFLYAFSFLVLWSSLIAFFFIKWIFSSIIS